MEVFEDALARVSRQLAVAARRSASELKEARLAQARTDSSPPRAAVKPARASGVRKRVRVDTARESPGRKKREAGSIAAGSRRQAKRDSRGKR